MAYGIIDETLQKSRPEFELDSRVQKTAPTDCRVCFMNYAVAQAVSGFSQSARLFIRATDSTPASTITINCTSAMHEFARILDSSQGATYSKLLIWGCPSQVTPNSQRAMVSHIQ